MNTAEFLKPELIDIEDITEINGCFLLRAVENRVIISTLPVSISQDILWEICILRDTFQQFVHGLQHGDLREITLEGDKGFVFLHKLDREFILLALAPREVNIGYVRLAMIDIKKRMNEKINSLSDENIQTILQACVEADEAALKIVAAPIELAVQKPGTQIAAQATTPTAIRKPVSPAKELKITTPTLTEKAVVVKSEVSQAIPTTLPSESIEDLIQKLITDKTASTRYLSQIFDILRYEFMNIDGNIISAHLQKIKEAVLDVIGTSLALFDISKAAQELKNMNCKIRADNVGRYFDRLANWQQRLIK
jgi:predicted regulator of Ras-like GTPase activity (Roadblock/LC7/MglB family)